MGRILLVNIDDGDLPHEVSRIMPLSRFLEFFASRRNTLVYPPDAWRADGYEALQLRTTIAFPMSKNLATGGYSVGKVTEGPKIYDGTYMTLPPPCQYGYYCQSWGTGAESDLMWKAYSGDDHCSVRVIVSTAELLKQCGKYLCCSEEEHQNIFFGRVKYMPTEEILRQCKDEKYNRAVQMGRVPDSDPNMLRVNALLMKQDQYRAEEECRLIYFPLFSNSEHIAKKDPLFHYSIEPELLISKVLINPRHVAPNCLVETIRKSGYKGSLEVSQYLTPPNIHIWQSSIHPRPSNLN